MIKKFDEFSKLNEDGEGGGGVSSATLGNTGGMGAIVSAQPSSIPGDVQGSSKGSGDIGQPLGTFTKQPALSRKKRKKKDKESRPANQVGAGIDKFYVTNYKESNVSSSNLVQSWQAFTESQKDTLKEKDQWWDENYERLIKFVDESPLPMEMVLAQVPSYETNWYDSTGKHNAQAFLNMFTIEEIEDELRQFEETEDVDFDPYDNDDMYADDEEMNESKHYFTSNLEPGKIYEVTEPFELFIQVDEDTQWGGNLGQVTPIVEKIQTEIGDTISTRDLFVYSRPLYNDKTNCFMHIPKNEGMFVKSRPKYDEFPLDKMKIIGNTTSKNKDKK